MSQSLAKSYAVQKQDEVAVLVVVTYPEGHQAVVALSDHTVEGDVGSLDARAWTLPSTTFTESGWTQVHQLFIKPSRIHTRDAHYSPIPIGDGLFSARCPPLQKEFLPHLLSSMAQLSPDTSQVQARLS